MAGSSSNRPRVGVDSDVVIAYLLPDQPNHAEGIEALFHEVKRRSVALYGSTLLLAEVLGGPLSMPVDPAMDEKIMAVLLNPNSMTLVQAGVRVGIVARKLRRELGLRSADSIHLASAVVANLECFFTLNSKDFPMGQKVEGVLVDYPRTVIGQSVLWAAP